MEYDLIVVGAGPAAFGCAIYAVRYNLKTLVIGSIGESQASKASVIQNYPGFNKVQGLELLEKFKEHAESFGTVVKEDEVKRLEKEKNLFKVTTQNNVYFSKTLLISTGTKRRTLNIPGEKEFLNKGVTYCAVCDGPFFKDKTVSVVGGSDAAASTALLLTEYASKVFIIYRKDKLRAKPYLVEKIKKNPKIEVIYNANVVEAYGGKFLEGVKLDTGKDVKTDGLFIEIGSVPLSDLARDLGVEFNPDGSIKVNNNQETNVEGVYAAGDVTKSSDAFRQVLVAAAEGSRAANRIYLYLLHTKGSASQWV